MMNINFYVKSMESFIILGVMCYERLTRYYLLHINSSEFTELGKTCQATCFLYQLWIVGVLLNILLDLPIYHSQSSPNETHEFGSWAENEIMNQTPNETHEPKMRSWTKNFFLSLSLTLSFVCESMSNTKVDVIVKSWRCSTKESFHTKFYFDWYEKTFWRQCIYLIYRLYS